MDFKIDFFKVHRNQTIFLIVSVLWAVGVFWASILKTIFVFPRIPPMKKAIDDATKEQKALHRSKIKHVPQLGDSMATRFLMRRGLSEYASLEGKHEDDCSSEDDLKKAEEWLKKTKKPQLTNPVDNLILSRFDPRFFEDSE